MSDLNDLNLSYYEILPHEPLDDISNHIKNLFNELVHHIPKKMKETVRCLGESVGANPLNNFAFFLNAR